MNAVPIVRPMIYVGTRGKQNPDTFEIAVLCRRLQRRLAEIVRFVDVGLLPLLPQSDKPAQIFAKRRQEAAFLSPPTVPPSAEDSSRCPAQFA